MHLLHKGLAPNMYTNMPNFNCIHNINNTIIQPYNVKAGRPVFCCFKVESFGFFSLVCVECCYMNAM